MIDQTGEPQGVRLQKVLSQAGIASRRLAEKMIIDDHPWALMDNRINVILLQPNVENVRGHLTRLDVGDLLNQIDFSTVDLKK